MMTDMKHLGDDDDPRSTERKGDAFKPAMKNFRIWKS